MANAYDSLPCRLYLHDCFCDGETPLLGANWKTFSLAPLGAKNERKEKGGRGGGGKFIIIKGRMEVRKGDLVVKKTGSCREAAQYLTNRASGEHVVRQALS
jgi:hypothetical protein